MWQKIVAIIVSVLFDKILSWFGGLIKKGLSKIDRNKKEKVDNENSQKYQDILNDPNKTEQQLDQATDDYLNGRKH